MSDSGTTFVACDDLGKDEASRRGEVGIDLGSGSGSMFIRRLQAKAWNAKLDGQRHVFKLRSARRRP